jgi:hypothetical protein
VAANSFNVTDPEAGSGGQGSGERWNVSMLARLQVRRLAGSRLARCELLLRGGSAEDTPGRQASPRRPREYVAAAKGQRRTSESGRVHLAVKADKSRLIFYKGKHAWE